MPDFHFPPDESLQFSYDVNVTPPPADEGRAKFVAIKTSDLGGTVLEDRALTALEGRGNPVEYSLSGRSVDDSPIWVELFFRKEGVPDQEPRPIAFPLAAPEVAAIEAPVEARPGATIDLRVGQWGALVFDDAELGLTNFEDEIDDPARVPASAKGEVTWEINGEEQSSRGESITYTVPDDAAGTNLTIKAWRLTDHAIRGSGRSTDGRAMARVAVPRLRLVVEVDGEDQDPPETLLLNSDTPTLIARLEPEIPGTFAWECESEAVWLMGEGSAAGLTPAEASASEGDVAIQVTFTSEASGETWTADHTLTVVEFRFTRSPKKIVHPAGEEITFTCELRPNPSGATTSWTLDGTALSETASELRRTFEAAATRAERRKELTLVGRVGEHEGTTTVRIAQSENVGTALPPKTNEALDAYRYRDGTPDTFDTTFTDAEDRRIQDRYRLTRAIRGGPPDELGIPSYYGRLQYSPNQALVNAAMVTGGSMRTPAAFVFTADDAYQWNKEEFDSLLNHEASHVHDRANTARERSSWRTLQDSNRTAFTDLSELRAYLTNLNDASVSFKFLVDGDILGRFVTHYTDVKGALASLPASIRSWVQSELTTAYHRVAFAELRESPTDPWDHHLEPPDA